MTGPCVPREFLENDLAGLGELCARDRVAGARVMQGVAAITMAGFGNRFRKAGYTQPKYQIEAAGHPLFDWSMQALAAFWTSGWKLSFALRAADDAAPFIRDRCERLGIRHRPDRRTVRSDRWPGDDGADAGRTAEPEQPFAVFNIDTYVRPGAMTPSNIPDGCEGWIPCFPGPGDGWSFARVDSDDRVVDIREKERISDHATVGLYWFATAGLFQDVYARYFERDQHLDAGERYIAPMYGEMIRAGCGRADRTPATLRRRYARNS